MLRTQKQCLETSFYKTVFEQRAVSGIAVVVVVVVVAAAAAVVVAIAIVFVLFHCYSILKCFKSHTAIRFSNYIIFWASLGTLYSVQDCSLQRYDISIGNVCKEIATAAWRRNSVIYIQILSQSDMV